MASATSGSTLVARRAGIKRCNRRTYEHFAPNGAKSPQPTSSYSLSWVFGALAPSVGWFFL